MAKERMTARERASYFYMAEAMRRLEWDLHQTIEATSRIPAEWHQIAQRADRQPTERVTLRLDRDVVKFFRSMGTGYGPRINDVLRSYMHARLAGVIRGAETMELFRREEEEMEAERPIWGADAASLGEGAVEEADLEREARARLREKMRAFELGKRGR
jgi:uncharacterized protein (DUF4415 family)